MMDTLVNKDPSGHADHASDGDRAHNHSRLKHDLARYTGPSEKELLYLTSFFGIDAWLATAE
jgi:hypothetical protein